MQSVVAFGGPCILSNTSKTADLEIVRPLYVVVFFFNRKNVSIVHGVLQFFQEKFRQPKKRIIPDVVLSMLPSEFTRGLFRRNRLLYETFSIQKCQLGGVSEMISTLKALSPS